MAPKVIFIEIESSGRPCDRTTQAQTALCAYESRVRNYIFEQPELIPLHSTRKGMPIPMFKLWTEDIDGFYTQVKEESVHVTERYGKSCAKYF